MDNPKILNKVRLIQKCFMVRDDGKILALKRAADDHSRGGNWDLPGGGYEAGELVEDSIKREVLEEAGLIIHKLYAIKFTNRLNIDKGFFAGLNVFATCYFSREWEGEIKLSDEHTEYQWFTSDEFSKLNFGEDGGFFVASIQAYSALPSHA